jgi:hypothetical protein
MFLSKIYSNNDEQRFSRTIDHDRQQIAYATQADNTYSNLCPVIRKTLQKTKHLDKHFIEHILYTNETPYKKSIIRVASWAINLSRMQQ